MTDENLLLEKCLEITKHVIENDQRVFINIKIGSSFCFTFNNQEPNEDVKKKSPSVMKRNKERKEVFNDKKKDEHKFEPDEVFNSEQSNIEKFKDKKNSYMESEKIC